MLFTIKYVLAVVTIISCQVLASPVLSNAPTVPIESWQFMPPIGHDSAKSLDLDALIQPGQSFQAAVQSDWRYTCPHSGTASHSFAWSVEADRSLIHIKLTGAQGISNFDNLLSTDTRFTATLHGSTCVQVGAQNCMYRFTGTTIGQVTGGRMQLGLVTDREGEKPIVEEACLDVRAPQKPEDCSAIKESDLKPCTVVSTSTKQVS